MPIDECDGRLMAVKSTNSPMDGANEIGRWTFDCGAQLIAAIRATLMTLAFTMKREAVRLFGYWSVCCS